jgi:hypothetical protein
MMFNDGPAFNMIMAGLAFTAVIAAIVTIHFARKSLWPPKRHLKIQVSSCSSLITDRARNLGLEISMAGHQISDPYFLEITIENIGKHSITSSSFDQGRPIVVTAGAKLAVVGSFADDRFGISVPEGGQFEIEVLPELYKPGMSFSCWLITRGNPTLTLKEEHVIDSSVELAQPPTGSGEPVLSEAKFWVVTTYVSITLAGIMVLASLKTWL